MSVTTKMIIGGVVLVCVTAYVAFLGASSSWQYYLTVDECLGQGDKFAGRSVRVSGRVERGSLSIPADRARAEFRLQGAAGSISTACSGPLPDNLAEEMDVVVEGRLMEGGSLQGHKVLTKCASKYEAGRNEDGRGGSADAGVR